MKSINSIIKAIDNHLRFFICKKKDFQTNRHIVVFESDDWGSIRMSNKKDWDELLKMGYAVDKRPYERFDTLESAEDLEALFEVLGKHKDINGNHPVITANMLMANPDFERIKKSGFQEYYYEPITKTYDRYYGNTKVLELMRQGYEYGIFMPQSHGREHFNVAQWMKGLQTGNEDLLTAFKYGMCGIAPKIHPEQGNQLMVALKAANPIEQEQINSIVKEGLQMFEQLWGFKSKSFIAPCYTWNDGVEQVLLENGVFLLQGVRWQHLSTGETHICHYSGQHKNRIVYGVRNCTFEPATNDDDDSVGNLMQQIDTIFAQHRIAVFSTHRINFVGGIRDENRFRTLTLFDQFLTELLVKYPDVEFLSSDKLISIFS